MKLAPRPCPLCGSTDHSKILLESNFDPSKLNNYSFASRKVPEFMHFQMVVCPECNLCYASPIPNLSWFHNEYTEADFDAAGESRYAAQSYAKCLKENISSLQDVDGVLDIGTGDGAFLGELLKLGLTRIQGVEPSRAPIACAEPHVAPFIHQGFFEPDMFGPESFNLISCFQTIEHLPEPEELFASAFKMLRPGGCFFIVAHNYNSFSAKIFRGKSPIFDIEHLQLLSPLSAAALYERAGFSGVRSFHLLNRYPLSYWIRLAPLGEGLKKRVDKFTKVLGLANLALSLPVGNIAAIGFKPEVAV